MPPAILIIESHREVAEALHDVVASANYAAIVRSHVQELDEVSPAPAANYNLIDMTPDGRRLVVSVGMATGPWHCR